jgi:formamidopyrimidine-DNA glycosylase
LDDEQWEAFADAVRTWAEHVLNVESGEEVEYLAEGRDDNPFEVYGRNGEPCPACGAEIERVDVSGRSTYFCPACQTE